MNERLTKNELKAIFDKEIESRNLVICAQMVKPREERDFKLYQFIVSPPNYEKAKYSCTEDEKDFSFHKGMVMYKGFQVLSA